MKKSKRKYSTGKDSKSVFHMSSEEATLASKPMYDGYSCGHGAHGDSKYNRAKEKRRIKVELDEQI